jgi:hypothetical protein
VEPVPSAAKLAARLTSLKVNVEAGIGVLRLRGNRIGQVCLGELIVKQIQGLDPAGNGTLPGCYRSFTLEDNTFDSGDNQFLAFDLGLTGNALAVLPDVGIALAAQGKYIGNFIHSDARLFAISHKPEAFGNGGLNIVAT